MHRIFQINNFKISTASGRNVSFGDAIVWNVWEPLATGNNLNYIPFNVPPDICDVFYFFKFICTALFLWWSI